MYISRLAFYTVPGKTHEVATLTAVAGDGPQGRGHPATGIARSFCLARGAGCRVEQDVPDLATLEAQSTRTRARNSVVGRSR